MTTFGLVCVGVILGVWIGCGVAMLIAIRNSVEVEE